MMVASVDSGGNEFRVGAAKRLFPIRVGGIGSAYDIAPDGKRFLVNVVQTPQSKHEPITVVMNWTADLRK